MKAEFKDLEGKTLAYIGKTYNQLIFVTDKNQVYRAFHKQSCCENVEIEDICGDLNDLIGSPILLAEEVTNSEDNFGKIITDRSFTWTFYKLATKKGYVTIRWLGTSTGYYSEKVDFERIN